MYGAPPVGLGNREEVESAHPLRLPQQLRDEPAQR